MEPGPITVTHTPTLDPRSLFDLIIAFTKERENMIGHELVVLHSKKHSFVHPRLLQFFSHWRHRQGRATE